jgi:pyruvate/2-oxoglutarate dehydrogenase complex dihydrolipoamide acyltransferase (E2) component
MAEVWRARERACGREITVQRDRETGIVSGPAKCPQCGIMPCTWDLVELIPKQASGPGPGKTLPAATTAAIELAKAQGLDLATVTGTGNAGAITAEDVRKAIAARESAEAEDGAGIQTRIMKTFLAKLAAEGILVVKGTGRHGMPTKADVDRAIAVLEESAKAEAEASSGESDEGGGE